MITLRLHFKHIYTLTEGALWVTRIPLLSKHLQLPFVNTVCLLKSICYALWWGLKYVGFTICTQAELWCKAEEMIQHKGKSHVYDACRLHLSQAQRRPWRTMARQSFKSVQILWLPWSHGVSGSSCEAHLTANQGLQPERMQWLELSKVTSQFNQLFKAKQVRFYFASQLLTQKTPV